jgi:hypothetical protein
MNANELLNNLENANVHFMHKLHCANEVTLTECFNALKKNKAVLNFHLSTYMFQQKDLYNPLELAAAILDMESNLKMMLNKLNELK